MRTPIIIVGAGGFAKELIGYIEESQLDEFEILHVVSDEPFNNPKYAKYRVVPSIGNGLSPETRLVLAVADPATKRLMVAKHQEHFGRWITYRHPSAHVSPYVEMGAGCIVTPQTIVAGDAVVGDFVFFNTNSAIGHDTRIGDYTTVFPNAEICGNCTVGADCMFGIGSYVLPGLSISDNVKVSAGAIVRKSIASPCTVYGDPAAPRGPADASVK